MMDQKPTPSKLKRILPKKCKVNVSPLQQHDKNLDQQMARVKNQSRLPTLASPNTFENSPTLYRYQPLSPPSNTLLHNRTTRTSSISANTKIPTSTIAPHTPRGKRSHSLHYTNHPRTILLQQIGVPQPPLPSPSTITFENTARPIGRSIPSNKKIPPVNKTKKKRHSFSSSSPQRSRTLLPEEEVTKISPSAAAIAALTPTSSRFICKTSPPDQPPVPQKSRSTPLRPLSKIKTYNVSSMPCSRTERSLEKKKRQQELEELISGRRGSTLKLSMTPKHTLLT